MYFMYKSYIFCLCVSRWIIDYGELFAYRLTILSQNNTIDFMITLFRDSETEKVWRGEFSRRLPNQIQAVARRKLRMLNNARVLDDLRIPPANRLERLSGDRDGQWSIRINDQWRICFVWTDGKAEQVEICDYH